MAVSAPVLYELLFEPWFDQLPVPELERCHCHEQVPVPPEVEAVKVLLPPVQIVPPPEMVAVGSATTVTATTFDTGSSQPVPLQFRTTR